MPPDRPLRNEKRRTRRVGYGGFAENDDEEAYENEVYDDDDYTPSQPWYETYAETPVETAVVRCCGACCCVLLGICVVAWVVHAVPVSTITDIPSFARSALWMSIAHHTDAWNEMKNSFPPPPPQFGDGRGNFPDA